MALVVIKLRTADQIHLVVGTVSNLGISYAML